MFRWLFMMFTEQAWLLREPLIKVLLWSRRPVDRATALLPLTLLIHAWGWELLFPGLTCCTGCLITTHLRDSSLLLWCQKSAASAQIIEWMTQVFFKISCKSLLGFQGFIFIYYKLNQCVSITDIDICEWKCFWKQLLWNIIIGQSALVWKCCKGIALNSWDCFGRYSNLIEKGLCVSNRDKRFQVLHVFWGTRSASWWLLSAWSSKEQGIRPDCDATEDAMLFIPFCKSPNE